MICRLIGVSLYQIRETFAFHLHYIEFGFSSSSPPLRGHEYPQRVPVEQRVHNSKG